MSVNGSENKYRLLGEPHGTASAKLKKSLLFKFVKELNLDNCFRCGEKITDIDNFSIEHKISWQSAKDPVATFYDLNNIAFSHTNPCNSGAGVRKLPHPTQRGENHSHAKLTNDIVINIKKDLRLEMRNCDISKKYNISKQMVSQIKTGYSWKYTK
jgi:hypothetical protein